MMLFEVNVNFWEIEIITENLLLARRKILLSQQPLQY